MISKLPSPKAIDKVWHVSRVSLLAIGLIVAAIGIISLGAEMGMSIFLERSPRWPWITISAAMVLGGAALVQTLNVEAAFALMAQVIPLLHSRVPGGKRATDPPEGETELSAPAQSLPSPTPPKGR